MQVSPFSLFILVEFFVSGTERVSGRARVGGRLLPVLELPSRRWFSRAIFIARNGTIRLSPLYFH
jgi:hypothetical protein